MIFFSFFFCPLNINIRGLPQRYGKVAVSCKRLVLYQSLCCIKGTKSLKSINVYSKKKKNGKSRKAVFFVKEKIAEERQAYSVTCPMAEKIVTIISHHRKYFDLSFFYKKLFSKRPSPARSLKRMFAGARSQ